MQLVGPIWGCLLPVYTFVLCESSFRWFGAQFLSPACQTGILVRVGQAQASSWGPSRSRAELGTPSSSLMNSPPSPLYLLPSFPSPHPGLTVTPSLPGSRVPQHPRFFPSPVRRSHPASPARAMWASLEASPWWAGGGPLHRVLMAGLPGKNNQPIIFLLEHAWL